jgi:hypothetical protein
MIYLRTLVKNFLFIIATGNTSGLTRITLLAVEETREGE